MEYPHKPVLVDEVVKYLVWLPDGVYVDGTVGTGGHSLAIAMSLSEKGCLICLDRDPDAIQMSQERLSFMGNRALVRKANYIQLVNILRDFGIRTIDGILLDLGMSSLQLERSGRGFSFSADEPLDMRMDPDDTVTAYDIVNKFSLHELERILRDYGEERRARQVARAVIRARKKERIETSLQLAVLVKSVFPHSYRPVARHPATRTFQAIRIAVNKELDNIKRFLEKVPQFLSPGGRMVVLSYHSLEDRLVKKTMFEWEKGCICPPDLPQCNCGRTPIFRRLTKKAIRPGRDEVERNPRARSTIMRIAEKI